MSLQIRTIVENFPTLIELARGSAEASIRDLQDSATAQSDSLIFVWNQEHFRAAADSISKFWVTTPALLERVPGEVPNVLVTKNVQLSMALIAKKFFPLSKNRQLIRADNIHPDATISPTAKLASGCIVEPGARIGDGCVIGANAIIGANSVLEPGVEIGAGTHIHPLVSIGHSCEIGQNCIVKSNTTIGGDGFGYAQDDKFNHFRITHYGRVIVEDDVHIGSGVQIDRGTYLDSRIGRGTKIDNHCHFGHNIVIGKNTLITGGMIAAGSVTIGSNCVFGGRTTIKGHISICDGVHAAGISGITKSITKPGEYGGLPLQVLNAEMRTRASLKSVPGLIKQVRRIAKHLGLSTELPGAERDITQ